jgi:hypothetical protein
MRVFACYIVSKLQRHRCPTFGALRPRNRRGQTDRYIFIYIDYHTHQKHTLHSFMCVPEVLRYR